MTKKVVGKLYTIRENDEENTARYMGGDVTDSNNYEIISNFDQVVEATTGNGWNELELPSYREVLLEQGFPSFMGKEDRSLLALMFSSGDIEKQKQAIQLVDPQATFGTDSNGYVFSNFKEPNSGNSVNAYVNKPGLSTQDISQGIGEFAALLGAGKLLGLGKQGVSIAGNMLRAGGAGGLGSVSSDYASNLLSGEGPVDSAIGRNAINYPRALTTAALETATIGMLDVLPIVVPAVRQLMQGGTRAVNKSGEPTKELLETLKEFGIKWEEQTQEWREELISRALSGRVFDPREATIVAEANTLPGPNVPLTQGSVSGMPSQQLYEDQMRKGVFGQEAAEGIRTFDDQTMSALDANQLAIQKKIAGDAPVVNRNQGAELAQQSLASSRQQAKGQADAMYDQARVSGRDARFTEPNANQAISPQSTDAGIYPTAITPVSLTTLSNQLKRELGEEYLPGDLGGASQLLKQLEEFSANRAGATVNQLFTWRQKLNKGTPGTDDAAARKRMKSKFDDFLSDALDNELIAGTPESVNVWRQAINNYRDFATTWKSGNLVDKLTRTARIGDGVELEVAPGDAANFIFNSSNLGFMNKRNLQRDLLNMKQLMPAAEFDLLRQELFLRIMDAGKTSNRQISGAKLLSAIEKVVGENSAVLNAAFTGSEISLIRQFARVADRATNTQANRSNSGIVAVTKLQDVAHNLAKVIQFRGNLLENFLSRIPVVGATMMTDMRARLNVPHSGFEGTVPRTGPVAPATIQAVMPPSLEEDIFNDDQRAIAR